MPNSLLNITPESIVAGQRNQADWIARRDAALRRSRRGALAIKALGYGAGAAGMGLSLAGGLGGSTPMAGMVPSGAAASSTVPAGTLASGALATGGSTLLPSTALAGTLAPYAAPIASQGLAPAVWSGAISGAGGGGGGAGGWGGLFRGSDLMRYGVPAGLSTAANIYGTRSANTATREAAEMQQLQYERTQAFLEKQAELERQDALDVEAEKKRQWEAEQEEKRRRYAARQPWRDAGMANLTRMNTLMDWPTPMPSADMQQQLPLSWLDRRRG